MVVKHKWNAIPDDWVSLGLPPNESRIDLHVALKPQRENALVNALYEVSRPRSPKHVLNFYPSLVSSCSAVPILKLPADLNVQTAAAIFSLLNDYLLSTNKPTLGFINPWLYEPVVGGGAGFKDIRLGRNEGCGQNGFPAVRGWDAVRPARLCFFVFGFADSDSRRSPA
jgi:hypothetical protein